MAKQRKMLTKRERIERTKTKKELQEKGILPPDKPKLNRKKFAREVLEEYEKTMGLYECGLWLNKAIGCMVSPEMRTVSAEEVGVLKLIKLAMEAKKFSERLSTEGRSEYTLGEFIEKVVTPVLKL